MVVTETECFTDVGTLIVELAVSVLVVFPVTGIDVSGVSLPAPTEDLGELVIIPALVEFSTIFATYRFRTPGVVDVVPERRKTICKLC